jgi:hypothetical protein
METFSVAVLGRTRSEGCGRWFCNRILGRSQMVTALVGMPTEKFVLVAAVDVNRDARLLLAGHPRGIDALGTHLGERRLVRVSAFT